MPRRPRPARRQQLLNAKKAQTPVKVSQHPTPGKPSKFVLSKEVLSEQLDSGDEFEEGSGQASTSTSGSGSELDSEDSEDEVSDVDAPRVSLWEEDNDDFMRESGNDREVKEAQDAKQLQNNLQDLPLGALRRVQPLLSRAEPESDSSDDSSVDDIAPETRDVKGKGKERVEWSTKPRTDLAKRSNKHAPVEMSAKRPVSRKRIVVDVPKIVARDPRFLPTAGEYDPQKFQNSYGFLSNNRKSELQTLRETLKKARKMLASSPRDSRAEREQEVERLERAVKRAESMVNRDRMTQVERNALAIAKKEEHDKRTQGKGEWFLKKTDKQKLLTKARFEALAKDGGQRAVKKAIAKKQKKVSQKEKRSRPYAKGEGGGYKRGPEGSPGEVRPNKRMRI